MDTSQLPRTDGPVISTRLRKLIDNLDARFPRAAGTSIDERNRTLQLLAEDLSVYPIDLVERATQHWIGASSYMPKLAELRKLIDNFRAAGTGERDRRLDQAERANARLDADNPSFGYRWIQTENDCRLYPVRELRQVGGRWLFKPSPPRVRPEEIDAVMKEFGIPSSSTIGQVARNLGGRPRAPTAEETEQLLAEQPAATESDLRASVHADGDDDLAEMRG